jgi:transcriptional regulator with XRE-family HTH domain
MSARNVLAENLKVLMEWSARKGGIGTQQGLAAASGIGQSSASRILKGEQSVSMNMLESIAAAYGLRGWQLLVPNLDPSNPPVMDAREAIAVHERESPSMSLGERVQTARKRLSLTQARVARVAGLSRQWVSQIESGTTVSVRGQTLTRLAEALQVDREWLLEDGHETANDKRPPFHEEEEVLTLYRTLAPAARILWKALGRTLLDYGAQKPKEKS